MKKLLIALLVILALSTIAVYIFIPSKLKVSDSVFVHTTDKWAMKFMADSAAWHLWFPQQQEYDQFPVTNDIAFEIDSIYYNAFKININNGKKENAGIVHLLSLKRDSLAVVWDMELDAGMSPLKRLRTYGYALQAKKSMQSVLDSFKAFMEVSENVYGVHIVDTKIPDSILVSTKTVLDNYPSDEQVYSMFKALREHYTKYAAVQVGNPMLNITIDEGRYQIQVAIPINKSVPETASINMKYMFKGNTLRTEVVGGHSVINKGLNALHRYKTDFGYVSPAIPFQSLITNRIEEKDSSKWKTILYYPVK